GGSTSSATSATPGTSGGLSGDRGGWLAADARHLHLPRHVLLAAGLAGAQLGVAVGPLRPDGGDLLAQRLVTVSAAQRAAQVMPAPVPGPVGGLDQFLVGAGVAVAHQVARPLPAENRVARDPPRGAAEVGFALQEIQEQRRVVEPPAPAVTVGEGLAEQLAG